MGGHTLASEDGFRTGLMIGCGVALVSAAVAVMIPAIRGEGNRAGEEPASAEQAPARV
jgi:hypothetical protein